MASTTHRAVPQTLSRVAATAKMLSAEREHDLLVRYHANEDKAAMDELVRSHMPIIFRVASRSAQNPGVDINDLVQTATEGLLIAINRWSFAKSQEAGQRYAADTEEVAAPRDASVEPDDAAAAGEAVAAEAEAPRASRLATYAMWWMRMLLTDSVVESRGMVARAKGIKTRKALFNLPMAIKTLDIALPVCGSDVARIAAYLGVGEREVEDALAHAAGDVMLDEPVGESGLSRGEVIADERAEDDMGILTRLSNEARWNAICEALMALPPRDRFILITRYLMTPKWKLDRLSDTLKMSRERIRQIGDDGLRSIRQSLANRALCTKPVCDSAARKVDALTRALETAAASPATLSVFLRTHGVAIGPTRIVNRRIAPANTTSFQRAPVARLSSPEVAARARA
jgi:RNA polymerase sigma-32 factor